jgi:hypothetical protein
MVAEGKRSATLGDPRNLKEPNIILQGQNS